MNETMTFEVLETGRGRASVALRRGRRSFVQVFEGWDGLPIEEARALLAKVSRFGAEELVGRPCKEIYWPLDE